MMMNVAAMAAKRHNHLRPGTERSRWGQSAEDGAGGVAAVCGVTGASASSRQRVKRKARRLSPGIEAVYEKLVSSLTERLVQPCVALPSR